MGSSLLGTALKMTSGTVTIFYLFGRIIKVLGFIHDKTIMPAVKMRGAELAGIDCVLFVE
jgi:hypothetical protein